MLLAGWPSGWAWVSFIPNEQILGQWLSSSLLMTYKLFLISSQLIWATLIWKPTGPRKSSRPVQHLEDRTLRWQKKLHVIYMSASPSFLVTSDDKLSLDPSVKFLISLRSRTSNPSENMFLSCLVQKNYHTVQPAPVVSEFQDTSLSFSRNYLPNMPSCQFHYCS